MILGGTQDSRRKTRHNEGSKAMSKSFDIYAAASGHKFRATERVPGWCVRCGGDRIVHEHPAHQCRPTWCGGIDLDPCRAGRTE